MLCEETYPKSGILSAGLDHPPILTAPAVFSIPAASEGGCAQRETARNPALKCDPRGTGNSNRSIWRPTITEMIADLLPRYATRGICEGWQTKRTDPSPEYATRGTHMKLDNLRLCQGLFSRTDRLQSAKV